MKLAYLKHRFEMLKGAAQSLAISIDRGTATQLNSNIGHSGVVE